MNLFGRPLARCLLVVLPLATSMFLGASAHAQSPAPAPAPDPFTQLMESLQIRTETPNPPDFVVKSRPPPGSLHYLPVGAPRSQPASKILTPDEIRSEEADLQATRLRGDRVSGRKSAPLMQTSAAPPPRAPKKTDTFTCVVTCVIK